DIHEAYLGSLADIYDNPDFTSAPRGQKVREKLNYQFTIENAQPNVIVTKDLERNKVIADYSMKEFRLYESCSNLAEDFGQASKFWLKLANPDGTVNSAYGYLIFKNKSHGSDFELEQVCLEQPKPPIGGVYTLKPKRRTPWEWAKESLIQDKD